MQQKKNFLPVFLSLFIFAAFLFFLSSNGVLNGLTGFLEKSTLPLQQFTFGIFNKTENSETAKLREENSALTAQLVDKIRQDHENQALRDQFQTAYPKPDNLLPAKIIGTRDGEMIIDKGEKDGVRQGMVVVVKNNLIGSIAKATSNKAVINVITTGTNLTAKTLKTESSGIVKVVSGSLILDNVNLSDKLEKDDFVLTKGDEGVDGSGFSPDLVIGKIVNVNKKASSLFQSAKVLSLVDFAKLNLVFIVIE